MTVFPDVKLKAYPVFPTNVLAESPILLDKTAGVYTFSLNEDQLREDIGAPSIADITAATVAAAASAASAAASAAALGNQIHQYDTRAQAIAATIPPGVSLVNILGRNTAGDFGGGIYKKLGSPPIPVRSWHFQSADGAYWQLNEAPSVNPRMFGAAGDGSTNDQSSVQDAIDFMSSVVVGGIVEGIPGDNYRVVVNSGITDLGLIIKSNVLVLMKKCQISLECTGSVYGIRLQSNAHIWGPGTVKTTVSSSPGSQGIWHAPICLGAAYGDVTSVGALGNYINATRWSIRNLTIDSARTLTGGFGIAGIGGISHGVIDYITFPDSSTMVGGINFDWGTVGSISSADIPTSRTNFDAGTAYTVHPNNIVVTNLKFGSWTSSLSCPIRLSGVHNFRVDGFEIVQTRQAGFYHTPGDCGYEFAPTAVKRDRHKNIVIKNGAVLNVALGTGFGYQISGVADNILVAIGSGYVPILPAIAAMDLTLENLRTVGNGAEGFYLAYVHGATVKNCQAMFHNYGIRIAESCERVTVLGGEYHDNASEGIYVGNATVPSDITIDGALCYNNGSAGTMGGIALASGARHTVRNCRLGQTGEGNQEYGIDLQSCTDATLENNHVIATAGGNAAYKLGASSTSYGVLKKFENNTCASSTTYTSGVNITPVSHFIDASGNTITENRALRASLTSATTPTAGAWKAGTIIKYIDPIASDYIGTFCATAGSPGTWKKFGPTAA